MSTRVARSLAAVALLLPITSCQGLPPLTGQAPGAVTGSIVRGMAPFPNATVVLLSKAGNTYSDREIKTTSATGTYTFENVPPGTYRVAFDRATPSERKDPARAVVHAANVDTYGYFSSNPFTLVPGQSKQIPQLNVAWAPNLSPGPDTVSIFSTRPVTFRWNAAPGATSYRVRVANDKNNTVFTSPSLPATATSFTWDGKAGGQDVPGGTYYWSLNVDTPEGFGGTNISAFAVR